MKQKPGIYENVPYEQYATWEGFNTTQIKLLQVESPRAMRHVLLHGAESTDALEQGIGTHVRLLEPETYEERFVVYEGRRQGKVWDEWEAEQIGAGKEILTLKQHTEVCAMADAVRAHAHARELLECEGRAEVSAVWRDPTTGALCKGRIDWVTPQFIVCLKTAADMRPFAFTNQATRLMYHLQMAAYQSAMWALGYTIGKCYWIAVGKKAWHDVAVYELDDKTLNRGLTLWEEGLQRAMECERNQHWPGCCPNVVTFELPEWASGSKASLITVGDESAFGDDE